MELVNYYYYRERAMLGWTCADHKLAKRVLIRNPPVRTIKSIQTQAYLDGDDADDRKCCKTENGKTKQEEKANSQVKEWRREKYVVTQKNGSMGVERRFQSLIAEGVEEEEEEEEISEGSYVDDMSPLYQLNTDQLINSAGKALPLIGLSTIESLSN